MKTARNNTPKRDIHFFSSSVGGVGKSSLSLISAELLNGAVFDASVPSLFLSRFSGIGIAGKYVLDSTKSLLVGIDEIMSSISSIIENSNGSSPLIVDLDTAFCMPFVEYASVNNLFTLWQEIENIGKVYFHIVYTPDTHSRTFENIIEISKKSNAFSEKSIVLWINKYRPTSLGYDDMDKQISEIEKASDHFGDMLASVFYIENNYAVKSIFRQYVYEAERSISDVYAELDSFSKAKLRSYMREIAIQYQDKLGFDMPDIVSILSSANDNKIKNVEDKHQNLPSEPKHHNNSDKNNIEKKSGEGIPSSFFDNERERIDKQEEAPSIQGDELLHEVAIEAEVDMSNDGYTYEESEEYID